MSDQRRQWCWNSSKSGYSDEPKIWKPYLPKAQAEIERAFQQRRRRFDLFTARRRFEMVFKHFDKTDVRIRLGVQMSDYGNRAFHFVIPGKDTHLMPEKRTREDVPPVTATPVATHAAAVKGDGGSGRGDAQAVWCWNASNSAKKDNWIAYSKTHQKNIERAATSPSRQARIFIKNVPYLIDLYTNTQVNEYTSAMRLVQKTIPTELLESSRNATTTGGGSGAVRHVDDKRVTTTTSDTTASPTFQWQWNSGSKKYEEWKNYTKEANEVLEKAYQTFIATGRSWSKSTIAFNCAGRKMEVNFDEMGQRTSRGFRGVRRLKRGGSSPKQAVASGTNVAVTLSSDGSLKTVPASVDTKLHAGSIVQFEVEKTGEWGRTFIRKMKGKVLGADARDDSLVVVDSMKDGRHYRLKASSAARNVIPLVGANNIPSWQTVAVTSATGGAASAGVMPIECNIRTRRFVKDKFGDPYYDRWETTDRNAPVDEIEISLSSVAVGDKVRALWNLKEHKDYKATVTALQDKDHASLRYEDGDTKKKCPISWMMPLVSKPFDPSTATFGQEVLLRPRKTASKHSRDTWELGKFQNVIAPPKVPSAPSGNANRIVRLWKGDVTHLEVDAVQNAANSGLWSGSGLCGAIHDAAGRELQEACKKIPVIRKKSAYEYDASFFGNKKHDEEGDRCDVGDTKVTKGFKLPAKYVLHTVGPKGVKPKKLRSAYRSALTQATNAGARSIALCCISTGIYGYPLSQATPVALSAVREWLDEGTNAQNVDAIIFCVFQEQELAVYSRWMPVFFPPAPTLPPPSSGSSGSDASDSKPPALSVFKSAEASMRPSAPPSYGDAVGGGARRDDSWGASTKVDTTVGSEDSQESSIRKLSISFAISEDAAAKILATCGGDLNEAMAFRKRHREKFDEIVDATHVSI